MSSVGLIRYFIWQRLNRELAFGFFTHTQNVLCGEIVIQHRLYPHVTVLQLAGSQYGARTAPILTELQLEIVSPPAAPGLALPASQ